MDNHGNYIIQMSSNAIILGAQVSFIQKQSKPENWNDGNTFHAGLSTPYVHCLQWKGKKATVMPHRKYHGFSVYYVLTEQDALQKIKTVIVMACVTLLQSMSYNKVVKELSQLLQLPAKQILLVNASKLSKNKLMFKGR